MLTAAEKPYFFIILILIIAVNVYISCRFVPKKEGFIGKILKKVLGAIPNMITQIFIGAPLRAIPHKGLRDFMLEHTVLNKGPGAAIATLAWAIIMATFTILVLVPLFIFTIVPLSFSFFQLLIISAFKGLFALFMRNSLMDAMNQAVQGAKQFKDEISNKRKGYVAVPQQNDDNYAAPVVNDRKKSNPNLRRRKNNIQTVKNPLHRDDRMIQTKGLMPSQYKRDEMMRKARSNIRDQVQGFRTI